MTEPTPHENAREKLAAIANWLGWQHENLSYGLKSPEDAIKLYDYWDVRGDSLPEMADEFMDDEGRYVAIFRKDALGYDPLEQLENSLQERAEQIYNLSVEDDTMRLEDERESVQKLVYDEAEKQVRKEYGLVGIK